MAKIAKPKVGQGELFRKIRKIVAKIPKGKVATYGQVAKLAGISDARVVGWALWENQDLKVPCHRVVKKDGFLAAKYSLGGWQEQRKRLESEGITFVKPDQVDLKKARLKSFPFLSRFRLFG